MSTKKFLFLEPCHGAIIMNKQIKHLVFQDVEYTSDNF